MADLRHQGRPPVRSRGASSCSIQGRLICSNCKAVHAAGIVVAALAAVLKLGNHPWPSTGLELNCLCKAERDAKITERLSRSGYVAEQRLAERYHRDLHFEFNVAREVALPWNPNTTAELQRQVRWGNDLIRWYEERWPKWGVVELPVLQERWLRAGCPDPGKEHREEIDRRKAERIANQAYWLLKWDADYPDWRYPSPSLCNSIDDVEELNGEPDLRFGSDEMSYCSNFTWLPQGSYTVVTTPCSPAYADYEAASANRKRLKEVRVREAGQATAFEVERVRTPAGNWLEREPNEYERQGFFVGAKRVRRPPPKAICKLRLPLGKTISCLKEEKDQPPKDGDKTPINAYRDAKTKRMRFAPEVKWNIPSAPCMRKLKRSAILLDTVATTRNKEMVPVKGGAQFIRYSLSDRITPPRRQVKEFTYQLIGSCIGFTPDTENEVAKVQTLEDISAEKLISHDPDDPDVFMD